MIAIEDYLKFIKDCRCLESSDKRPLKLMGGRIFFAKELRQWEKYV